MAPPARLEVVAAARHTGVQEGQHVPLTTSPFTVGRAHAEWELRSYLVSRQHVRLSRDADGRWTALDLSSTNGTLVNGKNAQAPTVLVSGDVLDLGAAVLRFVDGPPAALPVHEGLEAAITASPLDEAPWRVWADWLIEAGHPLGLWLEGAERPPASTLPWLGPLARWQLHRRMKTRWHPWGLLTSLTLPCVGAEEAVHTAWVLRHLPLVTAARFLVHLELEVQPHHLDAQPPVELFLEALRDAPLPRSLRTVTLTGLEPDAPVSRIQRALTRPPPRALLEETYLALRRACPHLESGVSALVAWEDVRRYR